MNNNSNFLYKYIPNTITVLSLCCGLSSVRFSINEDWKTAILLIIFAAIFDFFDGWFASKLKGGSYFGAELDSLSDIISFGVAPSLLIYFWTLSDLNSLGWSISMFFVVCAALRLARFTADIYLAPIRIDKNTYFVGIPSPGAAGLSLLPIFLYIEFEFSFLRNAYLNLINLCLIGFLMISKIPTFSLKKIVFSKKYIPWIIILSVIICISLISNIWVTLIVIGLLYVLSIVYTIVINLIKNN
jgi:CDP-diacylglycerol--serine O-phosphatidyltransferase|tara:strand:- start:475 stop:1203 length:729 start_codon:yes stop_codon:yes gene_type:complete